MTRRATGTALHTVSSAPPLPPRQAVDADTRRASVGGSHRVIAELDVHGEIDSHAAMCLRLAVADTVAGPAAAIVIDLRDLVAIDDEGIAVLRRAQAVCRRRGVHLGLLIGVRSPEDTLAHALGRAGLATQSHDEGQPPTRRQTRPQRDRLRPLPPSTSARAAPPR